MAQIVMIFVERTMRYWAFLTQFTRSMLYRLAFRTFQEQWKEHIREYANYEDVTYFPEASFHGAI